MILDGIHFRYKFQVLVIKAQLFLGNSEVVEVRPVHEQMQYLVLLIGSVSLDTKHEWTI